MLAGGVTTAPIPTLFNTGVSSNYPDGSPATLTADGANDQHYSIIAGVDGAISPFVTESGAYPFPSWSQDTTTSKWISPQATYAGNLQDAVGTYTYKTTFDLTGFNTNAVSISGQLVADNYVSAVRINGFDIGFSTQGQVGFAFKAFTLPAGHFVSGVNELEFDVINTVPDGGNPSGLRVELTGTVSLPQLTIIQSGTNIVFSWPTNYASGFALQTTANLSSGNWVTVTNPFTTIGTNDVVTNSISGNSGFFRLVQ